MSDQPAASLNAQYVALLTNDLEQIRVRIEEAEATLEGLRADQAMLERLRVNINAVPETRQPDSAPQTTAGDRVADLSSSAGAPSDLRPQKSRKRTSTRSSETGRSKPSLRELVAQYLLNRSEPRSAAEVAAALANEHPQRNLSIPLVRNAIEAQVAQGTVARTKQGRSVFYSALKEQDPEMAHTAD